ncbi:hypothetical protein VTI74DRAFT_4125 [Chaetomium olivicolor]
MSSKFNSATHKPRTLHDTSFFRYTAASGAALIVLGTFAASVSTTYWQLFLAQGVCTGLGNGLLFTPTMTVVSTYFGRRRGVALALAACGSTVGGLVVPGMAKALLERVWVDDEGDCVLAAGGFGCGALCFEAGEDAEEEGADGWLGCVRGVGVYPTFVGVFFPFFCLASYARDIQYLSYPQSLNLLLVLNGVGIVGRRLPGFLALWAGIFNVFTTLVATTTLIIYCWAAVLSLAGLYVWTVFFSLSMGGIQSLFPAALAALKFDAQKQGTRLGMVSAIIGFGALIGPPISGVLVQHSGGSYLGAQMSSGSCRPLFGVAGGCEGIQEG